MKIRKILPLVLLAVGSVFLLSSCDAMLDAIFRTTRSRCMHQHQSPTTVTSPALTWSA